MHWIGMVLCAVLLCTVLSGCMSESDNGGTADMQPSTAPEMSFVPQQNPTGMRSENTGEAAAFDWRTRGSEIEQRLNMISEIQSSRVVVSEGTALVGITFTNLYQGELTGRIRDMIAGQIQEADPSVQTVAVTAQAEDVARIQSIADQIASGTPVSQLQGEIDSIVRNLTTIQ